MAAVRKILYVWSVEDATLVQVLDVHFGRVVTLSSVTHGMNKLVSSSIDRSIKVWTVKHILERIHPISRQEKGIDSISASASNVDEGAAPLVVTSTRSGVGIWNTASGRLVKTLTYSQHISIVTHALVTKDARYVVSAESGNLLIWDQLTSKVLRLVKQPDMLQMMLDDNDTKVCVLLRLRVCMYFCIYIYMHVCRWAYLKGSEVNRSSKSIAWYCTTQAVHKTFRPTQIFHGTPILRKLFSDYVPCLCIYDYRSIFVCMHSLMHA